MLLGQNNHTPDELITYANRLDHVVVAEKKYWQIPGPIGEMGLYMAWDGSIYNVNTNRVRKWCSHTTNGKGESPYRHTWLISVTGKVGVKNQSIAKARAMAEIFVPKPKTDIPCRATMLVDDGNHSARPTDVVWSFSVSIKHAAKVKIQHFYGDGSWKEFPSITAALLDIMPTMSHETLKYLSYRISQRFIDKKRYGYKSSIEFLNHRFESI
jgi:hypothetical protein